MHDIQFPVESWKVKEREKWARQWDSAECTDKEEMVSLATTALWKVSHKSKTGYKKSD